MGLPAGTCCAAHRFAGARRGHRGPTSHSAEVRALRCALRLACRSLAAQPPRPLRQQTGLPFVDASMRELAATGYMSNRGRQNVASLLSKVRRWQAPARALQRCRASRQAPALQLATPARLHPGDDPELLPGGAVCHALCAAPLRARHGRHLAPPGTQPLARRMPGAAAQSLCLDWRLGAAYFESLLADSDWAVNQGNWAYNSGGVRARLGKNRFPQGSRIQLAGAHPRGRAAGIAARARGRAWQASWMGRLRE